MSGYSINITLWGEHCHSTGKDLATIHSLDTPTILAIKGGCIAEFNGRTVGTISTSNLLLNPDIPETHQLQTWFHERGRLSSSLSLSRNFSGSSTRNHPQRTIFELLSLQPLEKSALFSARATITSIGMEDFYFLACPLSFDGIQCMTFFFHHSYRM